MGLAQYAFSEENKVVRAQYTGTTRLIRYGALYMLANADPVDATFDGFQPGRVVDIAGGSPVNSLFFGLVHPSSEGSTGGAVSVIVPHVGDVTPVLCDTATDVGDGLIALASAQRLDDGGAWAAGDLFRALYDEDNTNNPFGADAVDATNGIVVAMCTRTYT